MCNIIPNPHGNRTHDTPSGNDESSHEFAACTFANPKDYDKIAEGASLEFKGIRAAIEGDGVLTVKGPKGSFEVKTALSDREKHLILCGGLLASL